MSDLKKRSGSRGTVTWGKDSIAPPARRSQRNSASLNKPADTPVAAPVMKRSITAKKILPRKTLVLWTDEMRMTLDGPDRWARGWISKGQRAPLRLRPQQGGGGGLVWAGIKDELVGPFRFEDGVKLNSQTYCQFLEDNFFKQWYRKKSAALVSAESQPNATSTGEQPRPSSGSARSSAVQAAPQSTPKTFRKRAARTNHVTTPSDLSVTAEDTAAPRVQRGTDVKCCSRSKEKRTGFSTHWEGEYST
ncbi:unnamed protein product [Ranitomeya imitator]|uniref:Uncharacterized protein n=1 Tax=Ranitomeya imitator TaxID=111125 RepID=A0ABN9KU40_9NEOB|nr:unnamed protein product [Ranitomeya imitator]